MGIAYNPKIVTNGLVLCLDAANANKSAKGFKNLLNLSTWTLGTGGTANFGTNGTVSENRRILDTGPFGVSTVVWDTPSNDATSDDDGGWNSSAITIDPTKLYRFSVWVRRKVIGNGPFYLGCHGWDVVAQQVLNRSDNVANQNPYFLATGYWGNVNEWYLITGHIWPAGSGTGSARSDSGIYNTSGTKISGTSDFVWQSTNTYTVHRSYLFYSTDTTTNQQWYQPRIDLCDGTEPTVAELISGVGSRWYDLAKRNDGNIGNSSALYNSSGYMTFDGVDDYVDLNLTSDLQFGTNDFTLEYWIYPISKVSQYPSIFTNYNGWGAGSIFLGVGHDSYPTKYSFWVNGQGSGASTTTNITYNKWEHLIAVRESGICKLYLNGDIDGTTVNATGATLNGTNSSLVRIGAIQGETQLYNGRISNVKIYNRSLTAAEVLQNFNAARGRFGL